MPYLVSIFCLLTAVAAQGAQVAQAAENDAPFELPNLTTNEVIGVLGKEQVKRWSPSKRVPVKN